MLCDHVRHCSRSGGDRRCTNGLLIDFFDVGGLADRVVENLAKPSRFLFANKPPHIAREIRYRADLAPSHDRLDEWLGLVAGRKRILGRQFGHGPIGCDGRPHPLWRIALRWQPTRPSGQWADGRRQRARQFRRAAEYLGQTRGNRLDWAELLEYTNVQRLQPGRLPGIYSTLKRMDLT
jgi:hypothetical protein